MTEAAFIIRLSYGPLLEPEWRSRSDLFRRYCLPRLRGQTESADIWVWTHPRHVDEARAWGVKTFTVRGTPGVLSARHTAWSDVQGLPRYSVQLLLGSDDIVGPEFVAAALRALASIRIPRALVTFQPLKMDLASGRLYTMVSYSTDRPSPFVALRQPDDERYAWVWALGHTRLHKIADVTVLGPSGHAVLVVHGQNLSTEIVSTDRRTAERPTWL